MSLPFSRVPVIAALGQFDGPRRNVNVFLHSRAVLRSALDAAGARAYLSRMDIRRLTPDYAVSPQIDPSDMAALAEAGFTTVINNRPSAEVPPSHHPQVMEDAARAAGLTIATLPVTHQTLTPDLAAAQKDICDGATGPVLAYCASGTRSTIVWAMMQAGQMDTDAIIRAAADQGYDLSQMRAQIDALAQR